MAGVRFASSLFAVSLILISVSPVIRSAEPAKDERCLTHKQMIDTLASIHNRGAAMYNSGDVAGCFRFFQGALLAIHPMLPKDIQEDVEQEMAKAERQFDAGRRAYAMHELIETVRKRLHPSGAHMPLPKPRKLDGETDEPPKSKGAPKLDSGKVKSDTPPLLLDPPKPNLDTGKPKPIADDGLTIPLPKPPEEPKKEPKKEPDKKAPVKIDPDLTAPPLKLDLPTDKPLITIPSGGNVTKPEPLPPPRIDIPLPTPAIPTSNPKPSPPKQPMPPAPEPPTIILPPGK